MSDTPETDAFMTRIRGIDGDKHWVPADTAKRLERERDEAREEISLKCQSVTIASGTISGLLKKSERLEKQIEGLNNFANERFYEIQRVRRERDEAKQIISSALAALPVGYIPAHTAESIPNRIADLCNEIEKSERERDEAREIAQQLINIASHCLGWHENANPETITEAIKRWNASTKK